MSDTKKSGLAEFSYWKKPSGKNGSLTVPPEKAKAILDFWRNSCKKTELNEKQDSIPSKNDTEDEKNFKLEDCKLKKEKTGKKIEKKEMSSSNRSTKLSLNKKNLVNKILEKNIESGEFSTEKKEIEFLTGKQEVVSPEKKSPKNSCKKTESNEKQDSIPSKNDTEDEKNFKFEDCKLKKEMSSSNKSTKLSLNKKNSVNKILKKNIESGEFSTEKLKMEFSTEKPEVEFSTEKQKVVSPEKKSPKKRKNLNNLSDKSELLAENSKASTEVAKVGSKRKINNYFDVKPNKKICSDIESTSVEEGLSSLSFDISINDPIKWKKITRQDLDLDYVILFSKSSADNIFESLEKETNYYSGDLSKVRVFGKWHNIPRKQVAFGDVGITYKFSGNSLPARPWTPLLSFIRDQIQKLTGFLYNFVLINRYKDGSDHIGEHRDNEKDLIPDHPIASLSLGQERDFVLRHALARTKATSGQHPPPVTVSLEHGSLLMMNSPTNQHWYHSLPVRKNAHHTRLNLTFRRMIIK